MTFAPVDGASLHGEALEAFRLFWKGAAFPFGLVPFGLVSLSLLWGCVRHARGVGRRHAALGVAMAAHVALLLAGAPLQRPHGTTLLLGAAIALVLGALLAVRRPPSAWQAVALLGALGACVFVRAFAGLTETWAHRTFYAAPLVLGASALLFGALRAWVRGRA